MAINSKVKKLYDALKADGGDVGTPEEFNAWFFKAGKQGYQNRKSVYDAFKADGADVGKNYEEFGQWLGLHAVKKSTPMVDKYRKQMQNSVDPNMNTASQLTKKAVATAKRATNTHRQPVMGAVVDKNGKKVDEFPITPAKTLEDLDREYAQEVTNDWENELSYQMKEADDEAAQIGNLFKSYIGNMDEVGNPFLNMTRGGGFAGVPHSVTTNNGLYESEDARKLQAAANYNRKRRELLQLEQDSRNGAYFDDHSFWRGMYDAAKDTSYLTGGASSIIDSGAVLSTKQDLDNGKHTESGDILLSALVKNSEAQGQYGDNQGWMYTGGVITTNMAPFFIQIQSAGFSSGMSKAIGKVVQGSASSVEKATMNKAVGYFAANTAKYIGKFTGLTTKAFGKAVQYGLVGAAQANTVGVGNIYNDVANRYIGQAYQDKDGSYKFGTFDSEGNLVHEGGEDFLTALAKGEGAQIIEFATELAGGGIDAVGTSLKKLLKEEGKELIEKYDMKNVSKFIDFMLNNELSKNVRYIKAGADRTLGKLEITSIVGESLEEELGIIANTLFTGDNQIQDLWDGKQQSQIWGGMFLSLGLMKGIVAPYYAWNAKNYYSYKHKLDAADVNLSQLLGEEKWNALREKIDGTTNDDMSDVIREVNQNVELGEKRQAVREYIQNLLTMRGYDIGNMLAAKRAIEDKGEGVSVKNMNQNQAYQQGREATGNETHDVMLDHDANAGKLASFLGITIEQLDAMDEKELNEIVNKNGDYADALQEYQVSKARRQGVIDNAQDAIDLAAQKAATTVDLYTDKSRGTVRNATVIGINGEEDYGVYIINGKLATHEDGAINISGSDDMILYYDPKTKKVEHADARRFVALGEELPAEEVKAQAIADAKEAEYRKQVGIIDGVVELGSQFQVLDEQGNEHTYVVTAENGDGTFVVSVDGQVQNSFFPTLEQLQSFRDESDAKRIAAYKAQREQQKAEQAMAQQPVEDNFDYSKITDNQGNITLVEVIDRNGENKHPDRQVFLTNAPGNKLASVKVSFMNDDGEVVNELANKNRVKILQKIPLDEFKIKRQAQLAAEQGTNIQTKTQPADDSSMIEGDRGGIEVEEPTESAPITDEEADAIIADMESRAEPAADIPLTPENWEKEFGADGTVKTPIGEVKMGENQIAKLFEKGRSKEFGMIKPTLENPDIIIEVPSNSVDGNEERASSYLFVKTFLGKNGKKIYYFKSVTIKKEGLEISVSSHYDRANRIKEDLKKGKLLYRFNGGAQTEQNQPSASVTTSQEGNAGSSEGKGNNNSAENNENNETLTLEDGTVVPMMEDGVNPDFSQLTAEQTAELYDTQFGEDAEQVISGKVSEAKKALDKANNMTVKGKSFAEQKASKAEKDKAIAEAQTAYDSAKAISDAYAERQLTKELDTHEGRMNLIQKAKNKYNRLKNKEEWKNNPYALWNETIGKVLHRLYDGLSVDVFDHEPQTVEEYVSSNISPYSLNFEGKENSKGVAAETGLQRKDFAKSRVLAAEGKGKTVDKFVQKLWDARPQHLENVSDQEIRNALLGLITSDMNAYDMSHVIEDNRIAQAEEELENEKAAAENAAAEEGQRKIAEEEAKKQAEAETAAKAEEQAKKAAEEEEQKKTAGSDETLNEEMADANAEYEHLSPSYNFENDENLSDEEREALVLRDDETFDEYYKRNGGSFVSPRTPLDINIMKAYIQQKYGDKLAQIDAIFAMPMKDHYDGWRMAEEMMKVVDANLDDFDAALYMRNDNVKLSSDATLGYLDGAAELIKARRDAESLGLPAFDSEGNPVIKYIIELANWAKEQGLEVDGESAATNYANLYVACKNGFGAATLVPDRGENINMVFYFPSQLMGENGEVNHERLRRMADEFNEGRDAKHSAETDIELTDGAQFYDGDTAREFRDFVDQKVEEENKPFGEQREKVPFEIKGEKSKKTYNINDPADRKRLIAENSVDDKDILDIDMPKHVHKAIKALANKMGLKVQFLYMGARANGWISNGTIYLALDANRAMQFVFGHEMTHAIKQKNPAAYEELVKVAKSITSKKEWEHNLEKVIKDYKGIDNYEDDDYVEEVVADSIGKFINDYDLAKRYAMRLNHPVLASIIQVIRDVKNLLYGKPYIKLDALERVVEKAYVDTANGNFSSSPSGERFSLRDEEVNEANKRFNNEIEDFKNKSHKGLMHLGTPSPILRASGVDVSEITLSPKVLNKKLNQHSLTTDDVKDLVKAIQTPIMVYKHGKAKPNIVVVTNADIRGNKLSIALELDAEGNVTELNNVSSIHDKNADTEVERLLDFTPEEFKEAMKWCDKEKVLDWISSAHLFSHMQTEDSQGLSLAKIINDFENPTIEDNDLTNNNENVKYSLRQKEEPKKKGIGYKVFLLGKDGKLYPPMVANPNGTATPVGVWLDADAAPIAGESKTGRPQVKQGGKGTQGGSGKLAYRPGWHLGVIPYALQFNRKDAEGNKTLFPKNFVFAEVEYAADVDYQQEAHDAGVNPSGKYQHSLAGLKHLPTDGYYMYRTNPNPETDPWVITGAMKVNRILTRAEQADLVKKAGREPQMIQEGDIVTDEVVNAINQEIANAPKFSLKVYHGSGADFTEFDFDHMGEGAGSQAFGWGGYVTSSEEIGKSYARNSSNKSNSYKYAGKEPLSKKEQDVLSRLVYDGRNSGKSIKQLLEERAEHDNYLKEKYEGKELNPLTRRVFESAKIRKGLLSKADKLSSNDVVWQGRNFYEVEIPENNGKNYLDWYADAPKDLVDKVKQDLGISDKDAEHVMAQYDGSGQGLYRLVSMFSGNTRMGSDKEASKYLSSLGYTGIKYPAGTIMGGAEEGDMNYVIFKPEDMRITEHTKFSIKTYHGSQASFDHFDHSFMGSGEGAQAYGWGTYVSEVEGIARAYAKQNARKHSNGKGSDLHARLSDAEFNRTLLDTRYNHVVNDIDFQTKNREKKKAILEEELKDRPRLAETYGEESDIVKDSDKIISHLQRIVERSEKTLVELAKRKKELEKDLADSDKELADLKAQLEENGEFPWRNLYTVEIPDDTGDNYISWDGKVSENAAANIAKGIVAKDIDVAIDLFGKYGNFIVDADVKKLHDRKDEIIKEKLAEKLSKAIAGYRGGAVYDDLAKILGGQKEASLFLKDAGFDGVKVIAQRNSGCNKQGNMNYVIFDENKAQITNHEKFSLKDLNKVNNDFNDALKDFTLENADKLTFHLGMPSEDLLAGGVANKPLKLYGSKLAKKIRKHDFEPSDLKDLPKSMQHPIAVFNNHEKEGNRSVLTELKIKGDNVLVSVTIGKGQDADINIISSTHGKRKTSVIEWFKKGFATFVNKKKAQEYLHLAAPIAAASNTNELNSAAKIGNSSETAKENGEKVDSDAPKTFEEFLDSPSLKFQIKNEEQRKAAENAYNWAVEHRPDKWKQYALVNMERPNQMPEYYEKKKLADQWRRYENKVGVKTDFKLFDLNKPFEENVVNVKGKVPEEFNPLKDDTNKEVIAERKKIKTERLELGVQYRELGEKREKMMHDALKKYMEDNGIDSESEVPMDVMSKIRRDGFDFVEKEVEKLKEKYLELGRREKALGGDVRYSLKSDELKKAQLEIINKTNPMLDDYHTGIRKVEDIKTFKEAYELAKTERDKYGDEQMSSYPDETDDILDDALENGKITIYSSKPIKNGAFVTPSRMQAEDYAGGGKVYEKTVQVDDVAWIDVEQGQYAKVSDDIKFSIRTYHGTGAKFDNFDLSHALEGEGSETFGHGVYVTNSEKIGESYAGFAKSRQEDKLRQNVSVPDSFKAIEVGAPWYRNFVRIAGKDGFKEAKDATLYDMDKGIEEAQATIKKSKRGSWQSELAKDRLSDYTKLKELFSKLEEKDLPEMEKAHAYRYEVEIPDDDGTNYLTWNESINNIPLEKWAEMYDLLTSGGYLDAGINPKDQIYRIIDIKLDTPEDAPFQRLSTLKGEELYHALEDFYNREEPGFGAERASECLSKLGFVGIKYPAGMIHGGAKEGDYNYVIFKESDAKIVGNTKYSLKYNQFEHDLEQWKKKNHLDKDAQPMEKPVKTDAESMADYVNRLVQYTTNQNLWKTAPKPTGFQEAMDKWKADNGLANSYPPVRPDKEDYANIDDYNNALKEYKAEKEVWKTAPKPKDFDLSLDLEDMTKQVRNIRRAVLNQKNYDKRTVKAISDLVNKMLNIGWGDGLSRGKVGRLLSAAKNATGANDVKKHIDNVMNILADNYLHRIEKAYESLINTKGVKADPTGVIKIGALDPLGQSFIKEYKKAMSMDDTTLDGYIADIEEDSAKNPDHQEANDYRLEGIKSAILFKQQIGGNDADIAEVENVIRMLKGKEKATKGDRELLAALRQKLFENKFDRIAMYSGLLSNIQAMVSDSKSRAKDFKKKMDEHKNDILHRANLDMLGEDSTYFDTASKNKRLTYNNPLLRAVMSSTYTFEQFLKFFGKHHANGEGYLYNYFIPEWHDAVDENQMYDEMNRKALDDKAKELFGRNKFVSLVGIDGKNMKEMDCEVTDPSNKETGKRSIHLKQGQMLYIYLVNKETDGMMKLRAMGITEEDVEAIENNLDPRVKAMGEWLQNEYLPQCQRRYQETHTRYFGAPMKEVENYFPLAINNRARNIREDVNQDSEAMSQLAGTSTGAIVTRRVNVIPLDIENADAFAVAFNHLKEMEEWSAMLPFRQDINTLLSSTHFRNQVSNQKSIAYGSGETVWNEFKQVAQIAAGTYKPKVGKYTMDGRIADALGAVSMAKISGRLWTAIKQTQSAAAFLTECDFLRFVKNGVNPYGSWKWAYDNLPLFRKRVERMTAGDTRIKQFVDSLEKTHDWAKTIADIGMIPNVLVDSVTCAVGARSVYETELTRLIKKGYPKEKTEEKAMLKASLAYNTTQQSSEGAFVAPMQVDRTYVAAALSLFKNSNYAYGRKKIEAIRGIAKTIKYWGHKNAMIESMKRQIIFEDGLEENVAQAIAKKAYSRSFRHNIGVLINYMTLMPISWALYKVIPYLLTGDDDDKKFKMVEEAAIKGLATTLTDDYVIPFASNALNAGLEIGEDGMPTFNLDNLKYQNLYINPATSDLSNIYSMIANQKWWSAGNKALMLGVQSLIGFNPETVGGVYQAIDEFDDSNGNKAKEWQMAVLKAISAPEESIRELYMDELGLKNDDIKKVPLAELEQRYAERQMSRDNLLSQIGMSEEVFNGYVDKYKKSFEKKIQAKMDQIDAYDQKKTDKLFDTTSDPMLKDMIAKKRAKDAKEQTEETISNEGLAQEKNEDAGDAAYRQMIYSSDLAGDIAITERNKLLNKRYAELENEYQNQSDAMKTLFKINHPEFNAYKNLKSEYTKYNKEVKELKGKLPSASGYDEKQSIISQIREKRNAFIEKQNKVN